MPTNLYGPGDYYHPENSHVIPGLIYRFHKAKIINQNKVNVWGLSNTKREFLYVDDMASAAIHLMNLKKKDYDKQASQMCSHINVGSGIEITIRELAITIKEVVDFKGKINFDPSLPVGSKRKLLDSSKIKKLGWKSKVRLKVGLVRTYKDFLKRFDK
jgi:GDP-L-fucose synthase